MQRLWQDSPSMMLFQHVIDEVLKRGKCMVGLIIAVIVGLIGITATAATAAVALQQSVQTVEYVQNWHENSSKLWTAQRRIDSEINSQLADLQQAVVMLGDQIVSLQRQISLKCDWNMPTFCVTPIKYNETHFHRESVKKNLLNHGNMTQEILDLQEHIANMFKEQLRMLSGENILSSISESLSNMNPMKQLKIFAGSTTGLAIIVVIILFLFYLV